MANISQYLRAILTAKYGEEVRASIHDALAAMNEESSSAKEVAETAQDSAKNSASAASKSESNAKTSEKNAKLSETNAKTSETNAKNSASAAAQSATVVGNAASLIEDVSQHVHSRIFRGKNLGSFVTTAQKSAIRDGSFKDLYLGDYWQISGYIWRIVDMDYWYNTDFTPLTKHHLVIMPDNVLSHYPMNDSATTMGGYVGSKMYKTGFKDVKKNIIEPYFAGMILNYREPLSNAVTDGVVTGVMFDSSTVKLPSEIMMYGTNIMTPNPDGTFKSNGYTLCKTQLALFDVAPRYITNGQNYWLRDVVSSDRFALVDARGCPNMDIANIAYGVRPYFCIG